MTDEPAPPSKSRMSIVMIALAIIGIAIPAVAISVAYKACVDTTVRGSVSVRGAGADWRNPLATCTADPTDLAVELGNGGPALVRAILDPLDGPRVEVHAPGGRPIVLTSATCTGLRVDLRRTGQRDDGSQLLDGSVAASCLIASGAHVDLDAWWRACHVADPE